MRLFCQCILCTPTSNPCCSSFHISQNEAIKQNKTLRGKFYWDRGWRIDNWTRPRKIILLSHVEVSAKDINKAREWKVQSMGWDKSELRWKRIWGRLYECRAKKPEGHVAGKVQAPKVKEGKHHFLSTCVLGLSHRQLTAYEKKHEDTDSLSMH